MKLYSVNKLNNKTIRNWILKKHYIKRMPPVTDSFGLFSNDNELIGIIAYGPPPKRYNNGEYIFKSERVKTIELKRLVVNEGLEKNVLSWFVNQSFRMMNKPVAIISYADINQGHHGYIYQALNFIYTGETEDRRYFEDQNGKVIHLRSRKFSNIPEGEKLGVQQKHYKHGKHRYIYIHASKTDRRKLLSDLILQQLPYPKGTNMRYDNSYKPKVVKHNYW